MVTFKLFFHYLGSTFFPRNSNKAIQSIGSDIRSWVQLPCWHLVGRLSSIRAGYRRNAIQSKRLNWTFIQHRSPLLNMGDFRRHSKIHYWNWNRVEKILPKWYVHLEFL